MARHTRSRKHRRTRISRPLIAALGSHRCRWAGVLLPLWGPTQPSIVKRVSRHSTRKMICARRWRLHRWFRTRMRRGMIRQWWCRDRQSRISCRPLPKCAARAGDADADGDHGPSLRRPPSPPTNAPVSTESCARRHRPPRRPSRQNDLSPLAANGSAAASPRTAVLRRVGRAGVGGRAVGATAGGRQGENRRRPIARSPRYFECRSGRRSSGRFRRGIRPASHGRRQPKSLLLQHENQGRSISDALSRAEWRPPSARLPNITASRGNCFAESTAWPMPERFVPANGSKFPTARFTA